MTMHIHVENMAGDRITLLFHTDWLVKDLKDHLYRTNSFPITYPCEVRLFMKSLCPTEKEPYTVLMDDTLVIAYGVTHDTVIHIVIDPVQPGQHLYTFEREANCIQSPTCVYLHKDELFVVTA